MNVLDETTVPLNGIHLVEASAGTGKTHAITTLYLRAVVELGLLPEQILVVTFTRAATAELRERIRQRLRSARQDLEQGATRDPVLSNLLNRTSPDRCRLMIERALLVIDAGAVMTIHGFCGRVLEQNAFEGQMPLVTDLIESVDPLVREIANDFIVTSLAERPEPELSALRAIGVDAASLEELAHLYLKRDAVDLDPPPLDRIDIDTPRSALSEFQQQALDWLEQPASVDQLSRLNKTHRPGQLGKRLAGQLEKVKAWLKTPAARLRETCGTFELLFELLEKNPAAYSPGLSGWFELLRACNVQCDEYRRQVLHLAVAVRLEFIRFLERELEARKLARGVQSYDDLLRRLRDAFERPHGSALAEQLARRFSLVLIDEFQDTDSIQFDVFTRIYSGRNGLFLIGDPKQSIYAFRGADVQAYLTARSDPRVQPHTLEVNWRSDPAAISAIQQLYQAHPDPFLGAGMQYVPIVARPGAVDLKKSDGHLISGLHVLWMDPEREVRGGLPKYLARRLAVQGALEQVRSLLGCQPNGWERPIRASQIAILTRTHRECQMMANALRDSGIPCVLTSDASVLDSDGAVSMLLLLRALVLPSDVRRVTALLSDPLVGLEPAQVEVLRDDADAWDEWIERLLAYRRLAVRSGILAAVVRLFDELETKQRLLQQISGERLLTDLFHVAELVQSNCRKQHLNLEAQLEWLQAARAGDCDTPIEDRQLRVEADTDAVMLTTVHRSKGLQFPFVICPFLWDRRGPSQSKYLEYRREGGAGAQVIHLDTRLLAADAPERAGAELAYRQEEARLLYVALTRAKHQTALVCLPAQGLESSSLGLWLVGGLLKHRAFDASPWSISADSIEFAVQRLSDPGVFEFRRVRSHRVPEVRVETSERLVLTPPLDLKRVVTASVRTTSYSALTAVSLVHADVGRDVDALPERPLEVDAAGQIGAVELPLAELPPGPRTGEALHELLEHTDFASFQASSSAPDVAATLTRFGLDAARFEQPVRRGVSRVLDVRLLDTEPELKLRSLAAGSYRAELEFLMRVSHLRAETLAASFGSELSGVSDDYVSDIQRLKFDPVTGYLRGFIDLVFEHAGRFYVVDYKSNALGAGIDAYSASAIEQTMRLHHYPIQAALYAAAVDRWLRVTRQGYRYAEHFGGVFYLFLRGMAPEFGHSRGVFFHRPSEGALHRFDAMLEGDSA